MSWITKNKNSIIRTSFLIPILLVVIISISHVVSWYEIGNPIKWAIYLSVAIEIFALTSVSAATININKGTIWFLFILVTMIQLIGNVFFSYNHINIDGEIFKTWVELIGPLFEDWNNLAHKRFLALIQGGTLPIMSLTALHFYLKFNETDKDETTFTPEVSPKTEITPKTEEVDYSTTGTKEKVTYVVPTTSEKKPVEDIIKDYKEEIVFNDEPFLEKINDIEVIEPETVVKESITKTPEEVKVVKREDIKEVKLREGKSNNITRMGSNKYETGNESKKIVYDNGRKRRNT